jgi:hypothetical protein
MPWFDLFVQAVNPGALDRARELAAQQRAAAEEKRRREALKEKAKKLESSRGKNPDTSITRRPIGVRSGGPFVIYAGSTDLGYRVISTGGTFKEFADVDGLNVLVEVPYANGQDIMNLELVQYYEFYYVGPGFPWRTRLANNDRQYSLTEGPFGEPCVLRVGDPVILDNPLLPIPIQFWTGPLAGRVWYVENDSRYDGFTGWVIAPYVLTFESSETTDLKDGDIDGTQLTFDVSKYLPLPAGDFTFEGWCRGRVPTNDDTYYEAGWTHVAVCRQNGVYTTWVGGDSSIAPQMTLAEGSGAVTLLGFVFNYRDDSDYKYIRYSAYITWDIGQVRITPDRALYSEQIIALPTAPWV